MFTREQMRKRKTKTQQSKFQFSIFRSEGRRGGNNIFGAFTSKMINDALVNELLKKHNDKSLRRSRLDIRETPSVIPLLETNTFERSNLKEERNLFQVYTGEASNLSAVLLHSTLRKTFSYNLFA